MVVPRFKRHRLRGRFRNDAGIGTTVHRGVEVLPESDEGAPLEEVLVTDQYLHHTHPPGELLPTPRSAPDTEAATVPPQE